MIDNIIWKYYYLHKTIFLIIMLNIVSKSQHGVKKIQFIFLNQTFIGHVKRKVIYLVNQAIFRQTQIKVILEFKVLYPTVKHEQP